MSELLNCGHPVECASEMLPDFFGDTPATQRIGTVHCRWCEEVARAEQHIAELEREREEAKPVLEAARTQVKTHGAWLAWRNDPKLFDGTHTVNEGNKLKREYNAACFATEQRTRTLDAARAAGESEK